MISAFLSVFLAKLLGPYCIIVAIGVLLNRKTYYKVMEDFFKNAAVIYIGGILALLFGLLIVLTHNIWTANWAVLITIFGWLGIVKGACIIIFPNTLVKFTGIYQRKPALLVVNLLVVLVIGAVLTFFGYFA